MKNYLSLLGFSMGLVCVLADGIRKSHGCAAAGLVGSAGEQPIGYTAGTYT